MAMSTNPKTILVADDESHILHVVSMKLRNAGFRVVTARDGREAFEMALHEKPDLLITDYHMPEMSGLELCQKLKEEASTSNIPAIMQRHLKRLAAVAGGDHAESRVA